jgi:hypothetical protein
MHCAMQRIPQVARLCMHMHAVGSGSSDSLDAAAAGRGLLNLNGRTLAHHSSSSDAATRRSRGSSQLYQLMSRTSTSKSGLARNPLMRDERGNQTNQSLQSLKDSVQSETIWSSVSSTDCGYVSAMHAAAPPCTCALMTNNSTTPEPASPLREVQSQHAKALSIRL